jgi:CRISPR-associated helicase Cas3/CRISPR-associated endonuclease Cas3-HD
MYYAHSAPPGSTSWEPLREHLHDVAERAAAFAEVFGAADEARLAGLLHDLGKYSDLFTDRLNGKAHGLDHWSLGAWAALDHLKQNGIAAALAIQGHHVGLGQGDKTSLGGLNPDHLSGHHPRGLRLTESNLTLLMRRLADDGLDLPVLTGSLYNPKTPTAAGMLDVRMLFSALVDADYLETEAHFRRAADGQKVHRPLSPDLRPAEALGLVEARLAELARTSQAAPHVNALRADLAAACLAAADWTPGLFTLSAPTGAGKTLAMLAFALRHARVHGLRRVVVAIPYLSIIEQTARIYRDLFDVEPAFTERYVLEHHSLAGTHHEQGEGKGEADAVEEARRIARWTAENWDSPLVVTTSVQILESLFSNRPSACRKLHRLSRSVILFDEVQTLPQDLAIPTLAALSRLAERYGSTVVFSTATQPAFDHLDKKVRELASSGWAPREVVPDSLHLFDRARRVRVVWNVESPTTWESLADDLKNAGTALCIVNLKRHARKLTELLRGAPGLLHLSTNLCPAHRERVLAEVRRRLDHREPCLLISTQCVEAGVDVDFPRVYRALAPLEAIAQAAGRCNRNGLLDEGLVHVFLPEDPKGLYPPGDYGKGASVALTLLRANGPEWMDLQSPRLFQEYYRYLYDLVGTTEGNRGKTGELRKAMEIRDFETIARLYRLIEQDAVNVLVPYDPDEFRALDAELTEAGHLTRDWIQRARRHAVSLYRPKPENPVQRFLKPAPLGRGELSDDWYLYIEADHYDRDLLGLLEAPDVWIA